MAHPDFHGIYDRTGPLDHRIMPQNPTSGNPLIFHVVISMGCLVLALMLMPAQAAWWQKALVGIFSVSFGFRMGALLFIASRPELKWFPVLLKSFTFIFMAVGVLLLPHFPGVVLILAGLTWRFIVEMVMR